MAIRPWVESGAVADLGIHDAVTDAELTERLRQVFGDTNRMSQLSSDARALAENALDGLGASRAADQICRLVGRSG